MKKIVLLSALLALTVAGTQAQTTPGAQSAVASQAQRMTQELALSPDQHDRLLRVLLLTRQHMDADRTAHHDDPGALRAAMAFDRTKSDELIREVLTPAQYVRYQQLKAARISQLHTTAGVGN